MGGRGGGGGWRGRGCVSRDSKMGIGRGRYFGVGVRTEIS